LSAPLKGTNSNITSI